MRVLEALDWCSKAYDESTILGGPDGRDGALVSMTPSGECVLAFRGTLVKQGVASVLDWINDFVAVLVHDFVFPGRVHKGFLDSLNGLWDGVIASLEDGGYKDGGLPWNKKLVIVGHSKGGALAVLAGCRLASLRPTVVTFASPMVGDLSFAVGYPNSTLVCRYEGRDDVVPWLPPFGYRPVGLTLDQMGEQWRARYNHAHLLVADLFDPFTRDEAWTRVTKAHSLETGYKPWVGAFEIRSAA